MHESTYDFHRCLATNDIGNIRDSAIWIWHLYPKPLRILDDYGLVHGALVVLEPFYAHVCALHPLELVRFYRL